MSTNERDTHFQGFAKLLWNELMTVQGNEHHGWIDVDSDGLDNERIEKFQQFIAQRAYDLAIHCLSETIAAGSTASNFVKDIPDMEEFSDMIELT